jgi:hypothetical protein
MEIEIQSFFMLMQIRGKRGIKFPKLLTRMAGYVLQRRILRKLSFLSSRNYSQLASIWRLSLAQFHWFRRFLLI